MKIGFVGLGKMGANMTERLLGGGHEVTAYDLSEDARNAARGKGAKTAGSLRALVKALPVPRVVWVMVPAGKPTEATISSLADLLDDGDILIDGGNSRYTDSIRRAAVLKDKGIAFLDAGTSGGIWGLAEGYSLMIGGDEEPVKFLTPIFEALAPAKDRGWGRVGPAGAGHFVKMVHNGIEYGMMQAFAEGFTILEKKEQLDLNLPQIAEIWRHGSVVRSWLLDLTAEALKQNPNLDGLEAYVSDSGEGRWTVFEAIDLNVSAPVITESLIRRIRSREENNFTDRMLSIMRNAFGGHAVVKGK